MRRIYKGAEPPALAAWKAGWTPAGVAPPWDEIPDPPRSQLRAALEADQRSLCCYCTGSIGNGAYHIEHFRPRNPYAHLTYEWSNLLASCQGAGGQDLVKERRHCGDPKGNWFEEGFTVDPTRPPVEALFRFPLTGKVAATKTLDSSRKNAVETTIKMLNLNAPALIARREAQLSRANEDARKLRHGEWCDLYLREQHGRLQEFWPALRYNYEKLWRDKFAAA